MNGVTEFKSTFKLIFRFGSAWAELGKNNILSHFPEKVVKNKVAKDTKWFMMNDLRETEGGLAI